MRYFFENILLPVFLFALLLRSGSWEPFHLSLILIAVYFLTEKPPKYLGNKEKAVVLLLIYTAFWLIQGTYFDRAILVYSKYLFLLTLYWYFKEREGPSDNLRLLILALGIFQCFGGLYQVFISSEPMPLYWAFQEPGSDVLKRAFGLYDNPNLFASFLLPLCLFVQAKESTTESRVYLPVFLLFLLVLVLTQGRGAILGFLVSQAVLFWLLPKNGKLKAILIIGLTLLGFVLTGRESNVKTQGANQRVVLYQGTLGIIQNHLLLGTGPGSFSSVYSYYRPAGGYYPLHAHNYFLERFAEMGILGLTLVLFLFLSLLRTFYFNRFNSPFPLAMLLALGVNALFNQSFHFIDICTLWLLCFLDLSKGIHRPVVKNSRSTLLGSRPLTYLLLVPVLFFLVRQWQAPTFLSKPRVQSILRSGSSHLPGIMKKDLLLFKQIINYASQTKDDLPKGSRENLLEWGTYLTRKYPLEAEIHFFLFEYLKKRHPVESKGKAIHHLLQAITKDPFSEKYNYQYLRVLSSQGREEKLREIATRVLYSNPAYLGINHWYDGISLELVRSYWRTGEYSKLKEILDTVPFHDKELKSSLKKELLNIDSK